MTDNTSAEELLRKKIAWQLDTRHTVPAGTLDSEVYLDKIMPLVIAYTKQRELALLERLEKHNQEYFDWKAGLEKHYNDPHFAIPLSAIQKEKERL